MPSRALSLSQAFYVSEMVKRAAIIVDARSSSGWTFLLTSQFRPDRLLRRRDDLRREGLDFGVGQGLVAWLDGDLDGDRFRPVGHPLTLIDVEGAEVGQRARAEEEAKLKEAEQRSRNEAKESVRESLKTAELELCLNRLADAFDGAHCRAPPFLSRSERPMCHVNARASRTQVPRATGRRSG